MVLKQLAGHYEVELKLNKEEWAKRRKYDGLCILVTHPDCPLSAKEICQLYRDKDVVEKDFQIIKSNLDLQPIRHRFDEKVNAHVTICMLALIETSAKKKVSTSGCS